MADIECFGLPGTGSALRSTYSIQIDSSSRASFLTLRVACIWDIGRGYITTHIYRGTTPFWAAALEHVIGLPPGRNRLLWPYPTLVYRRPGIGWEHFSPCAYFGGAKVGIQKGASRGKCCSVGFDWSVWALSDGGTHCFLAT